MVCTSYWRVQCLQASFFKDILRSIAPLLGPQKAQKVLQDGKRFVVTSNPLRILEALVERSSTPLGEVLLGASRLFAESSGLTTFLVLSSLFYDVATRLLDSGFDLFELTDTLSEYVASSEQIIRSLTLTSPLAVSPPLASVLASTHARHDFEGALRLVGPPHGPVANAMTSLDTLVQALAHGCDPLAVRAVRKSVELLAPMV